MNDLLEYVFFTKQMNDQFTAALDEKNIPYVASTEKVNDSILIQVSEQDIEPYWDDIDDLYDELAEQDQKLHEAEDETANYDSAGIHIELSNNIHTIAQVNPDVLNRILTVVSADEFSEFIDVIAKSIEKPDDTPICISAPNP